jgi:hypothetical protein
MIIPWLASRISKLYHPSTQQPDADKFAADVLQHERDFANVAREAYERIIREPGSVPHDSLGGQLSEVGLALMQVRPQLTGYGSDAGRVARMEIDHAIEGIRTLVSVLAPEHFEKLAGASLVPVTNVKVEMDPKVAYSHNASDTTSTPTILPGGSLNPVLVTTDSGAVRTAQPKEIGTVASSPTTYSTLGGEPVFEHPTIEEPAEEVTHDPDPTPPPIAA